MQEYFNMGGYAAYVWPSYGMFLLMLLGSWAWALRQGRQVRAAISNAAKDASA